MLRLQGAIDTNTRTYYTPYEAAMRVLINGGAKSQYSCPDCDRLLAFKNGEKKQAHFAHRAVAEGAESCGFYRTGESDIHKHGKDAVINIIDKRIPLSIVRRCGGKCNASHTVYEIADYANVSAKGEHAFNHQGITRRADVAILRGGDIEYIVEVMHTHCTASANRPANYCDVKAGDVIDYLRYKYDTSAVIPKRIELKCQREFICEECQKAHEEAESARKKAHEEMQCRYHERQIAEVKRANDARAAADEANRQRREREIAAVKRANDERAVLDERIRQKREERIAEIKKENDARAAAGAVANAANELNRQQMFAKVKERNEEPETEEMREQRKHIREQSAHKRAFTNTLRDIKFLGDGCVMADIFEDRSNPHHTIIWAEERQNLIMV